MSNRRYSIKFSGVSSSANDVYHDGKMSVDYCYMFSESNPTEISSTTPIGKIDYDQVFPIAEEIESYVPLMMDYEDSTDFDIYPYQGLSAMGEGKGSKYSIYRREYEVYERPGKKYYGYLLNNIFYYDSSHTSVISAIAGCLYIDLTETSGEPSGLMYEYDGSSYSLVDEAVRIYKGEWEPVALKTNISKLRDYNISNDRNYQYIMYPQETNHEEELQSSTQQIFANYDGIVWKDNESYSGQGKMIEGDWDTSFKYGSPVSTHWEAWSIIELEPEEVEVNAPVVKQCYKANLDQLWMFKYSLETGSQTQNISRNEFQTLGQFSKIGFGQSNFISGEVTALLGSELVLCSEQKYVERLRNSRTQPLSTNERTKMLDQWRKLVSSKNPKLLKDMKGQSWIVQIMSASNTPKNLYKDQPDTITFSWRQVSDTKNITIYGDFGNTEAVEATCAPIWEPIFGKRK